MNKYITAKEHRMIIGALKRVFSRSEHAQRIRTAAVAQRSGPKGGKRFICAGCKGVFTAANVNVDHAQPVISIGHSASTKTLDELIDQLWCNPSNLQILCKKCHNKKSKQEQKERRQHKRFVKAWQRNMQQS